MSKDQVTIYSNNAIELNGSKTPLYVTQREGKTVVYSSIGGQYKEYQMPRERYSLATDKPASGAAGRAEFAEHIHSLLRSISV